MEEKKIIITKVKSDYVEPVLTPDDYISGNDRSINNKLGGVDKPINESGDWLAFIPVVESQIKGNLESYGCTCFNTLNQIEILERKIFGGNPDYSDRALYIMANIVPPGADPGVVYETVRNKGLIYEQELPWSDDIVSLAQYACPKPLPQYFIDKAKGWLYKYILKHEYLPCSFGGWINNETIDIALKYSPVCVAVSAWGYDNEKKCYVRFAEDGHWTTLIGKNNDGNYLCLDSYAPFLKVLDKDFKFKTAKRIWLSQNLNPQQITIWQKILELLKKILNIDQQIIEEKKIPIPPPTPISMQPDPETTQNKPKLSRIKDWAKYICQYENVENKSMNNPGGIKGLNKKFLIFKTYQAGFDYLCDYLTRAATGKHSAYPKGGETTMLEFQHIYSPKSDKNNPVAYCSWICNQLDVHPEDPIKNML